MRNTNMTVIEDMGISKEYFELGQEQAKQGKWKKAEEFYRKAIEVKPDFHEAHLHLGDSLKFQGNLDEAINCYIKSNNINPSYKLPYLRIKRTLNNSDISLEQLEIVSQFSEEAFKQEPDNKQIQRLLINSLGALGKVSEAIKYSETITLQNNLATNPEYVKKYWEKGKSKGPDFIIIGFMKCGTTSLYDYILKHPQVLPASQKEIMFFNNQNLLKMGIDWYRSNFPPIPDNSDYVTGEASTLYVQDSATAKRIKDNFPNTKLIVILRNPIKRAISHYHFDTRLFGRKNNLELIINREINNLKKAEDIKKFIDGKSGIISTGLYIYFLEQWMSLFPKEQFLILKTEDLAKNTTTTMNRVFDFLGLADYQIEQFPRKNSGTYDSLDDELQNKLSEFYKPYNQMLEQFLQMNFSWE